MFTYRDDASSSNIPPSSVVQIAFNPNEEPGHCGYCNTNGSCSVGSYAFNYFT